MAGRRPKKAKAAFLGNAASLLLPRMVDELSLCIAPMARFVNGATGREARLAAPRMAEVPGTRASFLPLAARKSWVFRLPNPGQPFDAIEWLLGARRTKRTTRHGCWRETG